MGGVRLESNVEILLEDTLQSWYWAGFILADGHISKNNRLTIGLSPKDRCLLESFCDYISLDRKYIKERKNGVYVSLMHKNVFSKFKKKFDVCDKKTYNPPNVDFEINELTIALYIGFIDGDGCIKKQNGKRKDVMLTVKCHKTWISFLSKLENSIFKYFKHSRKFSNKESVKVNNKGYGVINITNNKLLKDIRVFVDKNLNCLRRKWDKIDLEYETRYEIADKKYKNIVKEIEKGYTVVEASKNLGLKCRSVYMLLRRRGYNVSQILVQ